MHSLTPCLPGVSEGSLGSPEPPQNLSVSPPRSTSPEPQDLSLPSTSRSYQHQYHHRDYHYPSHNFHPPSTSQCDNTSRGEHLASHSDHPVENLERHSKINEEYSARDENFGREQHVARLTDFGGETSNFGRENLSRFTDSGEETSSFGREASGGLSDFDRETTGGRQFEGEHSSFGGETLAHLEPSEEEERKDEEPPEGQRAREQVDRDQYQVWARRYILAKQGQVCVCVCFFYLCQKLIFFFYLTCSVVFISACPFVCLSIYLYYHTKKVTSISFQY